jgi:hypothetical protein
MAQLEYVSRYLDELLIISKEKLRRSPISCGHQKIAKRLSYRLTCLSLPLHGKKWKYLKYILEVLISDGIKPHPNKLQAILAINSSFQSSTTKEFLTLK